MKKLMALCLSVLMVLSMCSFTVMAEGTAVDFSAIANGQPANFVTGNLVLGENTITSSNEAVIALDGTVKRPLFEDATVSLTINGGEAVEVTVKAKTTKVLYANDFSSAVGSEWKLNAVGTNVPSAVADGKLNVVIGATTSGRTNITYSMPSTIDYTKPVSVKFDVDNFTDLAFSGADIRLNGGVYNADGTIYKAFPSGMFARVNTTSGFSSSYFTAGKSIDFKYDPLTGQVWTLATGALSANTLVDFAMSQGTIPEGGAVLPEGGYVKITSLYFTNATDDCTATFDVDDFIVYQEVSDEEALANATPAELLAHYSYLLDEEYVENGGNLDALTTNLKFTSDAALPGGVSLTWTSTNAAIASDGTVKRPILEAATATITGTLVCGEESISKSYNATILPLTIAGQSEIVDFDSYGLANGETVSATGWKVDSATVTNVVENGNSYGQLNSIAGYKEQAAVYTFQNAPTTTERYYVMSFKYKNISLPATVMNIGLRLNGKYIGAFAQRAAASQFHAIKWSGSLSGGVNGGGVFYGSNASFFTLPSGFVEMKIVVDTVEEMVHYYVGNSETPVASTGYVDYKDNGIAVGTSFNNITSAQLYFSARATEKIPATVAIDDVKFYAPQSIESVLPTLSDAEKVNYFKNLVQNSEIGTIKRVGDKLTLATTFAEADPAASGVAINWKSDKAEYVSNDGTLIKLAPIASNLTANVTATITAGSVSDTVSFAVPVADGTTLIKAIDFSDATTVTGSAEIVTDEDAAHGSVIHLKNEGTGHKATGSITSLNGADVFDRVILTGDVKYSHNDGTSSYGGISFKTIAGSNGINVYFNYNTNKIQVWTTIAEVNASGTSVSVANGGILYFDMPQSVIEKGEGEWVNVMVDHNVLSQTMYIYIDGQLINELPILQANMKLPDNGGAAIRGYSLELSSTGEIWADNISFRKYNDQNAAEVNAALNAALFDFASTYNKPVLTNGALPAMTIGKSWWISGTLFNRDLDNGALKPSNPAGYTYVTDGPAITWKIGNDTVTAINVTSPKEVTMTVTATANGITESKTFTRLVAPVAIRDLALGTADCLNGAWIEGATGNEKFIVATYLDEKLVSVDLIDFTETEAWDSKTGTGDRYNETIGVVNNLSTENPKVTAAYDQIKIFVVDADGITPLAYANADLHD